MFCADALGAASGSECGPDGGSKSDSSDGIFEIVVFEQRCQDRLQSGSKECDLRDREI